MIFRSFVEEILGTRSKIQVLRLLSSGQSLSGNRIARDLKLSPWACHRTLQELANLGIVELVTSGRNYLFNLNRDHRLARQLLLPLFEKEASLLNDLLQTVVGTISQHTLSIYLFGSVSRGDEAPFSGIDLLIVVPGAGEKAGAYEALIETRLKFLQECGNLIQPFWITPSALRRKLQENDPLFQKILTEGRRIYGKELADAAADSTQGGT